MGGRSAGSEAVIDCLLGTLADTWTGKGTPEAGTPKLASGIPGVSVTYGETIPSVLTVWASVRYVSMYDGFVAFLSLIDIPQYD